MINSGVMCFFGCCCFAVFFLQMVNTCVLLTIYQTASLPWALALRVPDTSNIWPKSVQKYIVKFSDTELHINTEWHKHTASTMFCWSQIGTSLHHFALVVHQQKGPFFTSPLRCYRNKHCKTKWSVRHCCVSVQDKVTQVNSDSFCGQVN